MAGFLSALEPAAQVPAKRNCNEVGLKEAQKCCALGGEGALGVLKVQNAVGK